MKHLDQVSIGIKTFLRDQMLIKTIRNIRDRMPDAQMIVADDGESDLFKELMLSLHATFGLVHLKLPFDSGFGAKSNAIADALTRPYLLIASDDFDFEPLEVRAGIEELVNVMESWPDVSIASGRVNNRPYEFDLMDGGDNITEVPVPFKGKPWIVPCDLTVNYSLIRKKVFDKVRWDNDVKIGGGEHGAFFLDCKRAGFRTVYVPGVNINEQGGEVDARYAGYRNRARSNARPCFEKRGIKRYILGSGQFDYEAADSC